MDPGSRIGSPALVRQPVLGKDVARLESDHSRLLFPANNTAFNVIWQSAASNLTPINARIDKKMTKILVPAATGGSRNPLGKWRSLLTSPLETG